MRGFSIDVSPEVEAFHRDAFVFDLHNDLLTKLTHFPHDIAKRNGTATFWNPLRLDLDLPRIRQGGIDALGCMLFSGFRFDAGRKRFWRQLDCARALARAHASALVLARTMDEVTAARDSGRVAFVLGVEGSYAIDDDVEAGIERLAEAGVRFIGPLWERDSAAGGSCRSRADGGLTNVGRRLVAACNARGLLVDVAHAGKRTFWDLHAASTSPVFSSHSGAEAVHAHPRNLDDEQLRAIGQAGGVVGVIFVASYLGGPFSTLDRLADHIDRVAEVAGEDAVALGSDFDGFVPLSRGMRDAADLPRLTEVLWRRGWRAPRLTKLLGENARRYFTRAEARV
ncbi:MAG TPA: membrane dipeptidase [Burkholderiaceae bacterium]|jgi:membrane dipeptidase|nr:membrane dipeptidase [Burkholderiaceae bacterium]